jgi:UDP-N-acetylglucosamine--N-acetylmuramyl-(pentapeptide) pyrophosphoryl-undecaprenol N-acetylglucosamine transferase
VKEFKVCFTGGGTGGHIFPVFPIHRHLQALFGQNKIVSYDPFFITSKKKLDLQWIQNEDIRSYQIHSGKLRRYLSVQNFFDLFTILLAVVESFVILRKERPDILFSKGGYVSVPPIIAAALLRIPIIAHESDSTPGLANKISIRFCKYMCISREEVRQAFPKQYRSKCVVTNVPTCLHYDCKKKERVKPLLFVMGGSQGALQINQLLMPILEDLLHVADVIHQTGIGKESDVIQEGYRQIPFLHEEYQQVLSESSLVISRSGATALADFIEMEVPSILLPIPLQASRGDQFENAKYLEKCGGAIVLDSNTITSQQLLEAIGATLEDSKTLKRMRDDLKALKGERSEVKITRLIIDTYVEKNGNIQGYVEL